LETIPVVTVRGKTLSLRDFFNTLKLRGRLEDLIREVAEAQLVTELARAEGLAVTDQELQGFADRFRRQHKLYKAADTHAWLTQRNLTPLDLQNYLEQVLLREKLADRLTKGKVEAYFAENRARYDRASLAYVLVEKEGMANELLSQIQEDGLDFAEAARKYSLDKATRERGGSAGVVGRAALPPAVATAVFLARPGDVVGPIKTDRGFLIVKVEEILLGQLDEATALAIQRQLFQEWLQHQRKLSPWEVHLHEHLK
jgi:parvulin-like peptidyl-prolyl isomerase